MTSIQNALANLLETAKGGTPHPPAEYLSRDGLLHCAVCDCPVECQVRIFGEVQKVRCICDCIRAEMQADEKRKEAEAIEKRRQVCFEGTDMISWRFATDDLGNKKLSGAMKAYADGFCDFLKSGRGLLLYGRNGTGKTFYASCIANALIDSGYTALVTNFARLANTLSGLREGKQEFIDSLSGFSLLVLDDLGAERQSEYMQEIVFSVVDARYNSGLPFIVTTNLTIEEIAKPQDFGRARIYSRILERCFPVEVDGADRRKAKLKGSFPEMAKRLGLQ